MKTFTLPLAAALSLAIATAFSAPAAGAPPSSGTVSAGRIEAFDLKQNETYDRFIIGFRNGDKSAAADAALSKALGDRGYKLRHLRRLAVGSDVFTTDAPLSARDANALMETAAKSGVVEYIDIDRIMQPFMVPNDSIYQSLWSYKDYSGGGINMPPTWEFTRGEGVVVAMLDTGFTDHFDLNPNVLPGYDFISELARSNDGNGRDSDASDPGDWNAPFNSTWHGTFTAGIVGAVANNLYHGVGIAHKSKLIPVRVLGRGGGLESDIADAIVWASGGSVPGVPNNTNPAEVLNLSFGASLTLCSSTYQQAINQAVANGATIVVAAGNSGGDIVSTTSPANCANVVTVAASDRHRDRAHYSTYGANVDLMAPGGEVQFPHASCLDADGCDVIYSLGNTGTTSPGQASSIGNVGTSAAAPHVTGVIALMQSVAPTPKTPAQIEAMLKATARPGIGNCTVNGCGAGLLDALAAVKAAFFDCSLSGWDATTGSVVAGHPYGTPVVRRLSDQCGVRTYGAGAYVTDTLASSAASSFRFYFLPEGTSGTTKILEAKTPGGQTLFTASLAGNAVTFRNAGGAMLGSPVAVRDNAWNSLQLHWSAATSQLVFESAYTGPATPWQLQRNAQITASVGTSLDRIGRIDLGQIASDVQRVIHFDAYKEAAGTGGVARAIRGDANGDGMCNSDDTTAISNEVLYALIGTGAPARGQPDCTEDGQMNSDDTTCIANRILDDLFGIPCD